MHKPQNLFHRLWQRRLLARIVLTRSSGLRPLEAHIRSLFGCAPDGEVEVGWQGGEPTLRGLGFFRRMVEIAEDAKRPGQVPRYTMQTNGTLIDDEWAQLLAEHMFLVGVSTDGPAAARRLPRQQG